MRSREEQEMRKPWREEEDLDNRLISVFRAECPSLSEEILRCLSLPRPQETEPWTVISSRQWPLPHGHLLDGKAPCQVPLLQPQ